MSGDVQPRKRKDKKKKRDDEASHGVHVTKMGSDDVLLHIHEEHGTGGNWCAKIIFFSLMAILLGLVCLIILENRGISDVDTPLSESRFSNYFDGWVDEHRDDHDDHHDSHGSLEHDDHEADEEHDDDDDDHGEPFEEEADHSEGDDDEIAEEDDNNVTPEEDDGDNATAENVTAEEDDEEEEEEDTVDTAEMDDNVTAEEADEENATGEDDNVTKEVTKEQNEDDGDDDDDNDGEDDNATKETSKPTSQATPDDDDEDPYDEDDDDGTFEIVDNDAAELELLKEKARQQAAESNQNAGSTENDLEDEANNAPSWASSQIKPKTGGGPQSLEEDDDFLEKEIRRAHDEMMQERYVDALTSFERLIQMYPDKPQLYLGKALAYDHYAEKRQSSRLLMKAVEAYKQYLEFDVGDDQLLDYRLAADYCMEGMRTLGEFEQSLPIYKRLISKFPEDPSIRKDLAVNYLMLDRLSDAKRVLQNVLRLWPNDGFALVHYGFVLKQLDKDYHNAVIYLRAGIESKAPGTQEGRFYFQLGESLQRLGRREEARRVFRQGADLKFYPSVYQRSLYNEANLKAQPFWSLEETSYKNYLKKLQNNWLAIKAEGLNALSKTGCFLNESENLKNKGDWKEFELFRRGEQRHDNCLKAPITCSLINEFPAARDCKRGQVKFSVMQPSTHVWPHCGPTNCRLRAHLGLVVPNGTRLRVAEQERTWQEGEFLIFDDSFEHEVWHEGDSLRLVLIVDIWHPGLTEQQRLSLTPI